MLFWVCVCFSESSVCVLLFVDVCVSERLLSFFIRNFMCAAGGSVGGSVQNFMQNELARSPVFTGVS